MYYYLFYSFIAYSLFGWLLEVLFHIYTQRKFINRGFLYGPLCPIYGVSAVLFIIFLTPLEDSVLLTFTAGAAVASIVELITGYLMEIFFNTKWWDYSDEMFNIKGYICLRFSIAWGILSVFFMKFINPEISKAVFWISIHFGEALYNIILIALIVDIVLSINSLMTFRQVLSELQDILVETKGNIDKLKEVLTLDVRTRIEERVANLGEIKERLSKKVSLRHIALIRAYPEIKSRKFGTALEDIRKRIEELNIKM